MDTIKALVMFTSLAVLLWVCASVTAQAEPNTSCTLTPVITDELKKTLFKYFDKSSETKLLEYKLVFDNYTNNQKCKDSSSSLENWRWFRTHEFGSVYFFFSDEYIWTSQNKILNITPSVEIKFQTTPANCLGNFTCRGQQTLIRNVLISDFNLKKELQQLEIEISKNVEICLNVYQNGMFENYRCCGFNRWNEYYCNDQSVYFKIVYYCVPFIISFPIMVYIMYTLWLSYRTVNFDIYSEVNTEINESNKIKCRVGESAHGYETVLVSKFISMEGSTWLLFDYYIHKLFFFFARHSANYISAYMPKLKYSANSDPKMQKKSCWKLIFFPNIDSPSFVTLLMERFLLTLPFVVLGIENLITENYARATVSFIFSIIMCLMLERFCYKPNFKYSFHRLTQIKNIDMIKQFILITLLFVHVLLFYVSIFRYVELIFKFIGLAFLEFEKADVIISMALVVVIYLYGVFETTNSQLKMCLRDFKVALDDMVITNRHEQTKDFIFLLECEAGARTDNQERNDVTSDIYDDLFNASTDRSVLVQSSSRAAMFEECSDDPESNTNNSVSNKLPLFYDTDGNLYVWKELFYSCCRHFLGRKPKSCLTKIVMVTLSCILSCYLLMLGMLVWYFEDFYDYSFLKTVFIIIAGGMLPKVLGMVFGPRHGDVPLQNTDNGFQIFVRKEIEAIYKKALVFGARPKDVPLQNTDNGFEISVRKEIESIYARKNVFKIIKRLLQKRCFHCLIYLSVTGILIACVEFFGLRKILATSHVFARHPRSLEHNAGSIDEYRTSTPESYSSRSLALELHRKLQLAEGTPDLHNITSRCQSLGGVKLKECNGTGERCLQDELPPDFETRVKQLAFKENLQVPVRYRDIMRSFAQQIPGVYDVIIVTALSSNHFKESQAFLKSLHADVFPLLSNFHLVMFDIGLSTEESAQLKRHCRCTVVNFTFEEFPPHFKSLKCFAWKPVIIGSVYSKANVVIWMDASIRFHLPDAIPVMISKAKRQGVVLRHNPANAASPYYTLTQMFEYFGDSPCAHLPFDQVESGFGLYHKEPLIQRALIDPWTACALRPECTCPVPQATVQKCPGRKNAKRFHECMRNDQSSLSIILAKLFREKYYHFAIRTEWFIRVLRGDQFDYFNWLESEKRI